MLKKFNAVGLKGLYSFTF